MVEDILCDKNLHKKSVVDGSILPTIWSIEERELALSKLQTKSTIKKWLLIIRANFLLATIIPLIFGIMWSLQFIETANIRLDLLFALIIGTISCHIAANTFNDYFDWRSGADKANTNYIMSISGGSRAIEFGLITERSLFIVALSFLIVAACSAIYLSIIIGPIIMLLSAIGAFAVYFYVAPPIRLAARYGLGELFIFLCFGPIFVAGVIYVLTGKIDFVNFFVGIPIGILITSCLVINEYPDLSADLLVGKKNLAVILGTRKLPWCIVFFTLSSYIITMFGIAINIFPKTFSLSIITIPLAIYEIVIVFKINHNRHYAYLACINNLKLYACFGITFIIASIGAIF